MILIRSKNKSSSYFKKDSSLVSLSFKSSFHRHAWKDDVTQHRNRQFEHHSKLNDNQADELNDISRSNKKNIRICDDDFILLWNDIIRRFKYVLFEVHESIKLVTRDVLFIKIMTGLNNYRSWNDQYRRSFFNEMIEKTWRDVALKFNFKLDSWSKNVDEKSHREKIRQINLNLLFQLTWVVDVFKCLTA